MNLDKEKSINGKISLLSELDEVLKKNGCEAISNIIYNKDHCIRYMKSILAVEYPIIVNSNKLFEDEALCQRAQHIVMTFSLGVYFSSFLSLNKKIEEEYQKFFSEKDNFIKVWILTSIFHDYGYYCQKEALIKSKIDWQMYAPICRLNDSSGSKYMIMCSLVLYPTDTQDAITAINNADNSVNAKECRYNNETMKSYHIMRKKDLSLQKNSLEKCDHGILGANLLYKLFLSESNIKNSPSQKNKISNNKIMHFYQDICFRIMEHNIWKCEKGKEDKYLEYGLECLCADNFKKVSIAEPLLFLLSITDTIEFVKRIDFNCESLITIINDIEIIIDENIIEIGYHDFKNNSPRSCDKWLNGIKGCENWIQLDVDIDIDGEKIKIRAIV